jgi:DNA-binding NtrC family response regulator
MSDTILIVDDEPVQRRLLENAVQKLGYQTLLAESGEEALEKLNQPKQSRIVLVILDIVMPDLDGMGVLGRMRDADMKIPVIVQTSKGGIDIVVSAMRAGAVDFIVKPLSPERLRVAVQTALKLGALAGELKRIKKSATGTLSFDDMIASSNSMARVIDLGQRAASSTIPILLEGETGVGKEVMARAIQGSGARRSKPFVTVNCGAIPDNLVESILFGHEKGAFTGATQKREGRFALADSGTIFLDEVGELAMDLQAKLLRVLQEGEFEPVGSSITQKIDVRVITATNRDLEKSIKDGIFREDLYYRLNVFPITIPPLRDRGKDILQLADSFAKSFSQKIGRPIEPLSSECHASLMAYHWPGNVRELQNVIERAVITAQNGCANISQIIPGISLSNTDSSETNNSSSAGALLTSDQLRDLEKTNIEKALKQTDWKLSGDDGAASLLGMPPSTLASRMKALKISKTS